MSFHPASKRHRYQDTPRTGDDRPGCRRLAAEAHPPTADRRIIGSSAERSVSRTAPPETAATLRIVKELSLLVIGAVLSIAGGYVADLRAARRDDAAARRARTAALREQQRQAVADLVAVTLLYAQTAGAINIIQMMNAHPDPVEFVNSPQVSAHAPNNQALVRAMALARLILVDAPRTVGVLDKLQNIIDAWAEARGKVISSARTSPSPIPIELAGPLLRCEASLERALQELLTVAGQELVASSLYGRDLADVAG